MISVFTVRHKGNFNHFEQFCNRALRRDYLNTLAQYCELGLEALREATPTDSGETAAAWNYEIENGDGQTKVWFTNDHEQNGINVVILLIYGHGTKNGGYVEGVDFVSPALRPIFQEVADRMFEKLTLP